MYEFGKIALVPFPFTDLSSQKLRPALIVSKSSKSDPDVVVLFITSKPPSDQKFSHFLSSRSKKFSQTGLKVDSYVRCHKVATLDKQVVLGELGELPEKDLKRIGKLFRSVFGF